MSTRKALATLAKSAMRSSILKIAMPKGSYGLFTKPKNKVKEPRRFVRNFTSRPDKLNLDRTELPRNDQQTILHLDKDLNDMLLQNIEKGRFSTQAIYAPPMTIADITVSGSDVLINWFDDCRGANIPSSERNGIELFNARTGTRQKIKSRSRVGLSMITPSYFVFGEGKGTLKIQRRSDAGDVKELTLPEVARVSDGEWRSNSDPAYETILVNGRDHFYLIDLTTGQYKEIKRPDSVLGENVYDFQLHGKIIAYKESGTIHILRAVDVESNDEVLKKEIPLFTEFYLNDNKIMLADIDSDQTIWSIIDLSGNILKEGNFKTNMEAAHYSRNIYVHKNLLLCNLGRLIHIVDINSGKHLTTLIAQGVFKYVNLSGFDNGKFIVSGYDTIRVVDFEAPDPRQNRPVKVAVINPNDTISTRQGTLNETASGLAYSDVWRPSQVASSIDSDSGPIPFTAEVHSSEHERIMFVYFPYKALRDNSIIVNRIVKCALEGKWKRCDIDMRSVSDSMIKFYGKGLLYKEELVDDKWLPIDLGVQQAEEFINSLK